jgi:type I restriction enzyme S subunit
MTLGNLKGIKLVVPAKIEQREIVKILDSIQKKEWTTSQKLHQTQSLKKSLMQDLLTGQVRVSVN